MSELVRRFEATQTAAKEPRDKADHDTLLELYSYFKQGSQGDAGVLPTCSLRSPSHAPSTTPGPPASA